MSPSTTAGAAAVAVVLLAVVVSGLASGVEGLRTRQRAGALAGGASAARPSVRPPFRLARPGRGFLPGGRGRRARLADRELPVLLEHVTRQLRSGASLPSAVAAAGRGRTAPGTTRLVDDLAAGVPLTDAVERWRTALPSPSRDLAAAALDLATEAGGAVAVVLDGVADTLRDRVALEREVAALSSQARASAAVLAVAPVAFSVAASLLDHRVADVLLGSPLGWACLLAGGVLDGLGAWWMVRLVGRAR